MTGDMLVKYAIVIFIVALIFSSIVRCGIFIKAKFGWWRAWIPLVSGCTYYKIAWGSGLLFFISCIPVIGQIYAIVTNVVLCKHFRRGFLFTMGVLFLPIVFLPILAFDKSEYIDVIEVKSKNNVKDNKNTYYNDIDNSELNDNTSSSISKYAQNQIWGDDIWSEASKKEKSIWD